MKWQETPYTVPLIVAGATSAISALYMLWRHRRLLGARTAALIMMTAAEWMLTYALELASVDLPTKVFWTKMQYLSLVMVGPAWLAFAFEQIGLGKWLTRRTLALLSIVPLSTLLVVFSNEHHGLFWSSVVLDTGGPFITLAHTHGVWFWVQLAYMFILLLVGSCLLIRTYIRSYHLYRWQVSALLFAAFVTVLESGLHMSRLNPVWRITSTVFAVPTAGLILAWGIFRLRREGLMPVARGAIVESMSDGVMVLDAHDRVVDLNPAIQHLIGHTSSEVIGQPLESVWPEWSGHMKARDDGVKVREQVALGQGNEQYVYDLCVSPLVDWRDHVISRVVVLRDITKRHRTEQALRRHSERLKEMLEQCTRELRDTQEELIRKERLAALGQLVGGVGHELRNPLGVIANTVYYLRLVLQENLEAISSGVDNAEKIVSDLVDLSRTKPAEREKVVISELVSEVLEESAPPEDMQVTTEIASDLATVFVDRRQIWQVLENLVSNAYEAMPEGGELSIKGEEEERWVCVSVSDNGCGIPEENKKKIFEPLFTTKATGMGLGLAVSKNLVEVNGGALEVESKVGVGTTFTMKLPVLRD